MRFIVTLVIIFGIIGLAVEKIKDLVRRVSSTQPIQGMDSPEMLVRSSEVGRYEPNPERSETYSYPPGNGNLPGSSHSADNPFSNTMHETYAAEIQCDGCKKMFIVIKGRENYMHHVVVYNNYTGKTRNVYMCNGCYNDYLKNYNM